jgi:F-box and leucine-rich repeat protein 1 (S-phase kinase-associated protein 2)
VTGFSRVGISTLIANSKALVELNLGWTNLSEDTLEQICSSLPPSMTKLNISGHRESLKDCHVREIIRRCPNLVELDVSDW